MRITFDVTSAVKPEPTGIGNYVTDLVHALLENHSGHFFSLGVRPKRYLRRRYLGDLARRPRVGVFPLIPHLFTFLGGKVDIFHALGVRLPGWGSFRKIVTIHDLNTIDHPEFTRSDWATNRARRIRETVDRADGIITPSEFTRERILAKFPDFPADRIRTVLHGVDLERYTPRSEGEVNAARKKFGLDRPYILHLGAFVPRKNKELLVQAFARSKELQEGRLVFVGMKRGNFEDIATEVRKLGLEDKVLFPGFVGRDEVAALLTGARVFAFPSRYEGFGLPVLEAMATGTPTAAARGSSLTEVGGEAVEFFDPDSPEEAAGAIEKLWTDEALRERLVAAGKKRAALLTWGKAARESLDFYQDILSGERLVKSRA